MTIINCTIAFNASGTSGGFAKTAGFGVLQIANSIVAKNIATTDPDAATSPRP